MKIGIIGSGISDRFCATILSEKHEITLFEKNNFFWRSFKYNKR